MTENSRFPKDLLNIIKRRTTPKDLENIVNAIIKEPVKEKYNKRGFLKLKINKITNAIFIKVLKDFGLYMMVTTSHDVYINMINVYGKRIEDFYDKTH